MYTNQMNLVRKILDTVGSISKLEASHLNIGNVNDVIMRLRKAGVMIETQRKTDAMGRKYTRWVKVYA